MDLSVDLFPLFHRELMECKVRDGEVVAVVTDPRSNRPYVSAAMASANALGASVFEISVPGMGWNVNTVTNGIGGAVAALVRPSPMLEAITEALKRSDLVIDLLHERMTHVPLRTEVLNAGARMLTISEPPEMLERMFVSEHLRREVCAVRNRFVQARSVRISSGQGTDLRYELADDGNVLYQYGAADVAGRWDNWPSGLVNRYPIAGSAEGTVVLSPGEMILPYRRYISEEIRMEVAGGYVRSIEGAVDAALVRDFLESWESPEVFATSHISLGVHPNAHWSGMAFYDGSEVLGMDGRCVRGAFLFTTGPDRYSDRYVEAHMDFPLRGHTVEFDGEMVVSAGDLLISAPDSGQ